MKKPNNKYKKEFLNDMLEAQLDNLRDTDICSLLDNPSIKKDLISVLKMANNDFYEFLIYELMEQENDPD